MSFNPRTRKGCDLFFTQDWAASTVSIHAPVKDATTLTYDDEHLPMVSIHAPVKDATTI